MWTLTSGSDGDSDGVPDSNDNVIINHNVTITGSRTVNNLTVNYADGKKLTISGNGASLSVEGNATNSNGEILITGGSAANPATLTIKGTLTNSGTMTINAGQRLVMDASYSAGGSQITATNPITIKSASNSHGSLYLAHPWTKNSASGVINYNRNVAALNTWDLISVPVSDLSISEFALGETDLAT